MIARIRSGALTGEYRDHGRPKWFVRKPVNPADPEQPASDSRSDERPPASGVPAADHRGTTEPTTEEGGNDLADQLRNLTARVEQLEARDAGRTRDLALGLAQAAKALVGSVEASLLPAGPSELSDRTG